MKHFVCVTLLAFTGILANGAETRLQLNQLPPAVQKAATQQAKGATVRGYSKETENGKTYYEVELTAAGKSKDLLLDGSGAIIEVEQQVDEKDVPAAAMQAITAHGGKILKVESVTRGATVSYEAVVSRNGHKSEVAVSAEGKPVKED